MIQKLLAYGIFIAFVISVQTTAVYLLWWLLASAFTVPEPTIYQAMILQFTVVISINLLRSK